MKVLEPVMPDMILLLIVSGGITLRALNWWLNLVLIRLAFKCEC